MTLGGNLSELLHDITELILIQSDKEKIKELLSSQKKIAVQLQKLIDENVKQDTAEYAKATEGIKEAIEAVKAALDDLEKVSEAITKIATVVGLVVKVAATV